MNKQKLPSLKELCKLEIQINKLIKKKENLQIEKKESVSSIRILVTRKIPNKIIVELNNSKCKLLNALLPMERKIREVSTINNNKFNQLKLNLLLLIRQFIHSDKQLPLSFNSNYNFFVFQSKISLTFFKHKLSIIIRNIIYKKNISEFYSQFPQVIQEIINEVLNNIDIEDYYKEQDIHTEDFYEEQDTYTKYLKFKLFKLLNIYDNLISYNDYIDTYYNLLKNKLDNKLLSFPGSFNSEIRSKIKIVELEIKEYKLKNIKMIENSLKNQQKLDDNYYDDCEDYHEFVKSFISNYNDYKLKKNK